MNGFASLENAIVAVRALRAAPGLLNFRGGAKKARVPGMRVLGQARAGVWRPQGPVVDRRVSTGGAWSQSHVQECLPETTPGSGSRARFIALGFPIVSFPGPGTMG
jgi:hypothetical protein